MNDFLIRLLSNALALLLIDQLVEGMKLQGFLSALGAAFLWGLINSVLRPFLNLLAAPINFLTLGLFTFVINGALLYIVSQIVRGFAISFGAAIVVTILLSIFSTIVNLLLKK
jgi:putative membrane protein